MKKHIMNLGLAVSMMVAADAATEEGVRDVGAADEHLKVVIKMVSGAVCYIVGTALLCAEAISVYDELEKKFK